MKHSSPGLKVWKLVPNWADKEQFLGNKKYMGVVSRLLIASPRQRLMEIH